MCDTFIPAEKLSKKARRQLNREKRRLWDIDPRTKVVQSKKRYSRKEKHVGRNDE